MIIHVKKRENPYVQIDKRTLSDNRLSFKAKGIMAYLLSKPESWIIRISDLEKHAKDGAEAIRTGLIELSKLGYAKLERGGQEGGSFWMVFERPDMAKTATSERHGENPDMAETPISGFTTPSNNDSHSNNDSGNSKKETPIPPKGDAPAIKELCDCWHNLGLAQIRDFGEKRIKLFQSRMKSPFFRDNWRKAILKVSVSDFCAGKNDRGWKATIDWFLRPDKVAQIMEGQFDLNRRQRNENDLPS